MAGVVPPINMVFLSTVLLPIRQVLFSELEMCSDTWEASQTARADDEHNLLSGRSWPLLTMAQWGA